VMAMSVNRLIERDLSPVLGQRDPVAMIRTRSTVPIRACGPRPRQQAGHMTARCRHLHARDKTLASWGPSTHDGWGAAMTGGGECPRVDRSGGLAVRRETDEE
jgi:hypothetical protein